MIDTCKIIGIDEVGRGPVAGPVCVCAVRMDKDFYQNFRSEKAKNKLSKNIDKSLFELPLRDSKKLSATQRERWFKILEKLKQEKIIDYFVASKSNIYIDKFGISNAISGAIELALKKINARENDQIKLDGLLSAPKKFKNQETIIKGDENVPIIALASIIGKVKRDRFMQKQALKYKHYSFEKNVGYGTKEHIVAIKKHGLTGLHRKSFLKNCLINF